MAGSGEKFLVVSRDDREEIAVEKFKRLLGLLFELEPVLVLEKLRTISLLVFFGVGMGYDENEIIKLCLREIGLTNVVEGD
jgi:hypothetical protein